MTETVTTENTISDIDSSIISSDTATILGEPYTAVYKKDNILYVVKSNYDTILKYPDLYSDFEFDDFNGDGLKDIRVYYMTNTPAVQDLLLFDKTKKNFVLVNNFLSFPASLPIKGTKYYYSYHKSGCADMNWDSDLFYIDNFKAIRIGNISGYECTDRHKKDGIYIHKVKGEKKILYKTLPISTIGNYKDYKWGFIKEYWTKNYLKFETRNEKNLQIVSK